MAKLEKIDDKLLEDVVGGFFRQVDTHCDANAAVRSSASLSSRMVRSLKNGSRVNVIGDGVYNFEDGRTWYPIDYPVNGWIVGRSIGLKEAEG
ncbi:MAG: SH3 domain-containing protein [Lachnospiraceae bacterium]|nr:SH3 domain-containing protein [Lachnospiraceae bacterium]